MSFKMPIPNWLDESCQLVLSSATKLAIDNNELKISVFKIGNKKSIGGLDGFIDALSGNIRIYIAADKVSIKIGKVRGRYDLSLWRDTSITIGDYTTCNGARIVGHNSSIVIGDDCLLSDEIIIQSADQHGIIDLKKGRIVNGEKTSVVIGDHVWIGRRSSILYGTKIGSGSIVGFGTLTNKEYKSNSLIVGVPGKVAKSEITWSRSTAYIDDYARKIMSDFEIE